MGDRAETVFLRPGYVYVADELYYAEAFITVVDNFNDNNMLGYFEVDLTGDSSDNSTYGLYVIQKDVGKVGYSLAGPYQPRPLAGTLYIANATKYNIWYHAGYRNFPPGCSSDEGYVLPGYVATLKTSLCLTDNVHAAIKRPGIPDKFTNKDSSSRINDGAYVVSENPGQDGIPVLIGPFILS